MGLEQYFKGYVIEPLKFPLSHMQHFILFYLKKKQIPTKSHAHIHTPSCFHLCFMLGALMCNSSKSLSQQERDSTLAKSGTDQQF